MQKNSIGCLRGFTLIELSIVLLIISLIAGGIVAGRSLVHTSRITSIIDNINKYKTAVRAFEIEYNGLPGDITNATLYWGSTTRNGNGDGAVATQYNGALFFDHLSRAGLVEGSYSYDYALSNGVEIGKTHPKTAIDGATFTVTYNQRDKLFTNREVWNDPKENMFILYQMNGALRASSLTPTDAYKIDVKIDDEKPGVGAMIVLSGTHDCALSHTAAAMKTTEYDVANKNIACAPIIPFDN